jgi:translation initiation factor 2 subunit 1
MRTASRRLGISLNELYEKAWIPLEETFGFVYEGLERAAREGTDVLLDLGLDERLAEIITKVAKEKIKVSYIKTRGILKISCPKPDGVVKIRKALQKAQKVKMSPSTSVKIYAVSPPRYRIEVTARDYKAANSVMRKATQVAVDGIAKSGGYGTFERG